MIHLSLVPRREKTQMTRPTFSSQFMTLSASTFGMFDSNQQWLIILNEKQSIDDLKESIAETGFYLDSEVFVAKSNWSDFIVYEMWRIGPRSEIVDRVIGNWNPSSGLIMTLVQNKYFRRKDMMGYHLDVVVDETDILHTGSEDDATYFASLWMVLKEQLNFTFTATGFGSWNDMIRRLELKETDANADALIVSFERFLIMDYTLPIKRFSTKFYIRKPVARASWNLYFMPFTTNTWAVIFSFLIFTGVTLWVQNKTRNMYSTNEDKNLPLHSALWDVFTRLVQQSSDTSPTSVPGQITIIVGSLTILVIFTCYSALLVSFLATLKPVYPFRDFYDLRKRPDWKLGSSVQSALKDFLRLADEGTVYKDVWNINFKPDLKNNLVQSFKEAFSKVLTDDFAFLNMDIAIKDKIRRNVDPEDVDEIVDTGVNLFYGRMAYGLPKGSPFRKIFNYMLSKMTSTGHLNRFDLIYEKELDSGAIVTYPSPSIQEVFVVFLFWGVGLGLSLIILLLERYVHSRKKIK